MSSSFRDMVVWQRAMELAVEVYRLVKTLLVDERFALIDQMRRAAVSVPSNIAEGHGRNSPAEFRHLLGIARGSLLELETQLELCIRYDYLSTDAVQHCHSLSDETRRMLSALITKLKPESP
jgi:four helix bundle protein